MTNAEFEECRQAKQMTNAEILALQRDRFQDLFCAVKEGAGDGMVAEAADGTLTVIKQPTILEQMVEESSRRLNETFDRLIANLQHKKFVQQFRQRRRKRR